MCVCVCVCVRACVRARVCMCVCLKASTDRKRPGSERAGVIFRTVSLYNGYSQRTRSRARVFCLNARCINPLLYFCCL